MKYKQMQGGVCRLASAYLFGGNAMNNDPLKNQTKYLYCILKELPEAVKKFELTEEQANEVKKKLQEKFGAVVAFY